jgi:predicted secreted protein
VSVEKRQFIIACIAGALVVLFFFVLAIVTGLLLRP